MKANVSMEQQSKEWALLKQLTVLIQEEHSFVEVIQKRFSEDKSRDEIIAGMVADFGD